MIFIFSFVLGADYLSYVKSLELKTHARAFLTFNILSICTVFVTICIAHQLERLFSLVYALEDDILRFKCQLLCSSCVFHFALVANSYTMQFIVFPKGQLNSE